MQRIWGSSDSNIFAVGGDFGAGTCTIMHFDGTAWSPMTCPPSAQTLWCVWGSSGNRVFAADSNGTIIYYNGTGWSVMYTAPGGLNDIWGSSASDVFAVGSGGTIVHYNGSSWSVMNSGTDQMLLGLWGFSGSDVFAVGSGGTILHYDGRAWSAMNSNTAEWLYGIWGTSGSDMFAVGNNGIVLRYDGTGWSTQYTANVFPAFLDVWGSSSTNVYAASGVGDFWHYNGHLWTRLQCGITAAFSVWGLSANDVYATGGSNGRTIMHYFKETTLVALNSFTATPASRAVMLAWSTEAEIDNAGFNILRAASEDGDYIKINTALISAEGSATEGAAYEFVDTNVKNRKTYWYKLEDIDLMVFQYVSWASAHALTYRPWW